MSRVVSSSVLPSVLCVLLLVGCAPTQQPQGGEAGSSSSATAAFQSFTMDQVKTHASEQDCYTVIKGSVYDVTAFIPKHPGGKKKIIALCGRDGTDAFLGKHGELGKAATTLQQFKIGVVK